MVRADESYTNSMIDSDQLGCKDRGMSDYAFSNAREYLWSFAHGINEI